MQAVAQEAERPTLHAKVFLFFFVRRAYVTGAGARVRAW